MILSPSHCPAHAALASPSSVATRQSSSKLDFALAAPSVGFAFFRRDSAKLKQAWLCARCSVSWLRLLPSRLGKAQASLTLRSLLRQLASPSSVATRQSSSKLGFALAAPSVGFAFFRRDSAKLKQAWLCARCSVSWLRLLPLRLGKAQASLALRSLLRQFTNA